MATPSRRKFLSTTLSTTAATIALSGAPAIVTAKRLAARADEIITGEGEHKFRVDHQWCQLPGKYSWQTTHNVAVDSENNLYVIHEGHRHLKDHPSIFVFDSSGKFVRAFGSQFQGGGHGLEIRKEGSDEFLYVTGYQQVKAFSKMTLDGETVWFKKAPMESGAYEDGEDVSTKANWSRKGFLPTDFAFLDDGGFLMVDGYGTYLIHRYDKDANWVSCFGGEGKGEGKFNLSHGIWVDRREKDKPTLMVTDRSRNTVQRLTMEGEHIETLTGFGLPANIDTFAELAVIPELKARVSILNEKHEVVAKLGEAVDRLGEIEDLREKPEQWKDGQFVHPHDACFDLEGNLFVAEWVKTGRVSKLTRVN